MTSRSGQVVAVMGPTASGKTGLAVAMARALGAELINADSRQAISELAVGVCKPSPSELGEVVCHGLDWRRLGDRFTVANFVQLAAAQVRDIWARGRLPILVGGTGLYIRALLEGFDFGGDALVAEAPAPVDPVDAAQALAEIRRVAPARYLQLDQRNPRRVGRALELARRGRVPARRPGDWTAVRIGCEVGAADLRHRILLRSERILGPELRQEVEDLLQSGHGRSEIAGAAIGYAEVLGWMSGELTREEALREVIRRTWRYARAQMTWLRREPDLVWIDADAEHEALVGRALALVGQRFGEERG